MLAEKSGKLFTRRKDALNGADHNLKLQELSDESTKKIATKLNTIMLIKIQVAAYMTKQ